MELCENFCRRFYKYHMQFLRFIFVIMAIFYNYNARAQNAFMLNDRRFELNIQFISANTARVYMLPVQSDETTTGLDNTPLLAESLKAQPGFQSRTLIKNQSIVVENNLYKISIRGEKLVFRLKRSQDDITKTIHIDTSSGTISFELNDEAVFGLGQGAKQFDRSGALYPMVVGSKYWKMKDYGGRVPVPWLISPQGWALFFHQPFGEIDLRDDNLRFTPQEKGVPIDFFISLVESPSLLMHEYGLITGFPPLPPRWTMGYMQSHRTLAGPQEVLNIAQTFREKELPCDAVIYLGTGWCPAGWNTGHGSFNFNPQVFTEPVKLLTQLKSLHFNPVLHVVFPPEDLYGSVFSKNVSPLDSSHIKNYWGRHRILKEMGAEGWWPDSGEKLSLNGRAARIRMYYEGDRSNDQSRTFALHRTGFAGMQRYGGWLWSGDVYSTWKKLEEQIPMGLNTGVSGIPYWGTDIGGFWSTSELDGELYTRWFQFGAFCPSFRSHGRNWHTRLPWGWNTGDPGPIEVTERPPGQSAPDSSELNNPLVEPICRKYLNLRYKLLPYNYTMAWEATHKGLPFMRPLWLYYQGNAINEIKDQYLWGRDLMIAPVFQKGATTRKLVLPEGQWYDFWSSEIINGGREIVKDVDLSTMPIYVRAGAVIPMVPEIQHTGENQFGPLEIQIYPGEDGAFRLYEDDGHSYDYLKDEYMTTGFSWNDSAALLTIYPENGMNFCPDNQREITVRLMSTERSKSITYIGKPVTLSFQK